MSQKHYEMRELSALQARAMELERQIEILRNMTDEKKIELGNVYHHIKLKSLKAEND